jgi:hypothetical protein
MTTSRRTFHGPSARYRAAARRLRNTVVDYKNLLLYGTVELLWRFLYCGPVLKQGNAITLQKQLHAYFVCKKTPSLCSRWSESFVYQCVTGCFLILRNSLYWPEQQGRAQLCGASFVSTKRCSDAANNPVSFPVRVAMSSSNKSSCAFDCASLNSVVHMLGGPGFERVLKPAVFGGFSFRHVQV